MTTTTDEFLNEEDRNTIETIQRLALSDSEKDLIVDEIKAEAWRRHTQGTIHVAAKREAFSVDSLRAKPKPEGWDESKARVKAQLEQSRAFAPIEGTHNSPFHAAEQREAAERQRMQDWRQRKELEIGAMRENRIKSELDRYDQARTASDKRAILESMSPEALARLANHY